MTVQWSKPEKTMRTNKRGSVTVAVYRSKCGRFVVEKDHRTWLGKQRASYALIYNGEFWGNFSALKDAKGAAE